MEETIRSYYENNAYRLRRTADGILWKLRFQDVDREDFYSLANEVFANVLRDFDTQKDFDAFLYACLEKRFKTEMTARNRYKRRAVTVVEEMDAYGNIVRTEQYIPDDSIDRCIGDEDGSTLGDILAGADTVETEIFDKRKEGYSRKMVSYLNRLSGLQRNVLCLISAGYRPEEIRKELHISGKQYANCCEAIHAYRNISVLF